MPTTMGLPDLEELIRLLKMGGMTPGGGGAAFDQFYDYDAANKAGASPDASGHWPSEFKRPGHPNEIVGGFNTRTGERVPGTPRMSEPELVTNGWSPESAKELAATLLDAEPLPGAGMPMLIQPGQAPLDMPGESFDAAPQGGGGGFDWKQLLPLLPLAVAGLKGGMPAMGGFGEGFTRGASVREEQTRLKRAQAAREAAESYAQMRDERQDAQAETEQQMRVLQMLPELADRAVGDAEAAGLDTPELVSQFAERRYADLVAALGRQVPGLDPALLRGMGGNIGSRVSARLRSKAAPYYDKLTKDADPATLESLRADTTPRYLGMTFADLERLASQDTPPARGKAEKVTPPNSLEAALARAVDAGDTAKADQIRREMAKGRTGEPGTWTDTGRVNEQGKAIYINSKTMATKAMDFGAKPVPADASKDAEATNKRRAVLDSTSRTLDAIDELITPDGTLKSNVRGAIGTSRVGQAWRVPGTKAYDAQAAVDRLRARLVTDLMAELKAQSRTGATGFGQLNTQELKIIQDSAAKLNPGQTEQAFETELKKIRDRLELIMREPDGGQGGVRPVASHPIRILKIEEVK